MPDDLLTYYERELTFLRQIGAEFAVKYPKIASRLLLEADKCEDPHVERLIQAFAFLAGRIHHKIDDEFPEITDALLGVLYPHYLAPLPSMSIVQFVLDPEQGKLTSGHRIEPGRSSLLATGARHAVPFSHVLSCNAVAHRSGVRTPGLSGPCRLSPKVSGRGDQAGTALPGWHDIVGTGARPATLFPAWRESADLCPLRAALEQHLCRCSSAP